MTFQLSCSAWSASRIDPAHALGVLDEEGAVVWGANQNPGIDWSGVPAGTQSLALICCDSDAPQDGSQANQAGVEIPKTAARGPFYHWVLVNIPLHLAGIPVGALSNAVETGGKAYGETPYGVQGVNDYTQWFADDEAMQGHYGGYDGPCPPWNDALVHRYTLSLYALDTVLDLSGPFTATEALAAMAGHVLAESSLCSRYALNPKAVD